MMPGTWFTRGALALAALAIVSTFGVSAGLAASPVVDVSPVAGRDPAPLRLKTLEGRSVSIQDLKGEVVVLNFWATWCKPCVAEMPVLAKLAERFSKRGLHVIAASVDENATHEELEQFAGRLPKGMDVWTGVTMSDMQRMDVQALPTTIIIDRQGTLVRVHHGQLGEGYLDPMLDELLGGKSGQQPGQRPEPKPDRPKAFDATEA
jgi:thiol-disulfide isomerase/thioredoxin